MPYDQAPLVYRNMYMPRQYMLFTKTDSPRVAIKQAGESGVIECSSLRAAIRLLLEQAQSGEAIIYSAMGSVLTRLKLDKPGHVGPSLHN